MTSQMIESQKFFASVVLVDVFAATLLCLLIPGWSNFYETFSLVMFGSLLWSVYSGWIKKEKS